MKCKLILIMGLVFLMTLMSVQALDVFKQGEGVDYKILCKINEAYCSNSTICNLSLFDPNFDVIVPNAVMGNQDYYYNYTLTGSMLNVTGLYTGNAVCDDLGVITSTVLEFEVTVDGKSSMQGYAVFYLLFILIVMGFLFMLFAHYTKEDIFSYFAGLLMLLAGVYLMIYGVNTGNFFIERATATVLIGIGAYTLFAPMIVTLTTRGGGDTGVERGEY